MRSAYLLCLIVILAIGCGALPSIRHKCHTDHDCAEGSRCKISNVLFTKQCVVSGPAGACTTDRDCDPGFRCKTTLRSRKCMGGGG